MTAMLPPGRLLLALAVVGVWGSNFVVIRHALDHLPPLLLAALRYLFAFLPAALLLPRPAVPWATLAAYGVAIGVGQFGLLFIAMSGGTAAIGGAATAHAGGWITPGIASLVIQTQVFFTMALAVRFGGAGQTLRLGWPQATGLALAVAGLGLIAGQGGGSVTGAGLALVLAAAASWAVGNIVAMRAPRTDMLAFVVWASACAAPVLAVLSWWLEGPAAIAAGLAAADASTWLAVAWQSVGNTLFGYAAWGWLLARHPASAVSPLALGVPVVGLGTSALVLGEPLPAWKLAAAALVLAGLGLHVLGGRWRRIPSG
jgi:O-acetylserine/cysteine efflux transporter